MSTDRSSAYFLYHEKQLSAMCGVHALNNLLQGPHFGVGDLAEWAYQLDSRERALLAPSAAPPPSPRVDPLTGNFNLDVLSAALRGLDVELTHADHAAVAERVARGAEEEEEAFLCHVRSHWLALRKLCGVWWNLDSRLPRPLAVPHEALREALGALRARGESVFVVRRGGEPSLAPPVRRGESFSAGREDVWHPIDYLLSRPAEDFPSPLDYILAAELTPPPLEEADTPPPLHSCESRAPAAASPLRYTRLRVVVPAGASGGMEIAVASPYGGQLRVTVPPNLKPGDTFEMQAPLLPREDIASPTPPPRTEPPRPNTLCRGYLRKRPVSSAVGRAHDRFLTLKPDRICWYEDHHRLEALGELRLSRDTSVKMSEDGLGLAVATAAGTLHLLTASSTHAEHPRNPFLAEWAQAIRQAVRQLGLPPETDDSDLRLAMALSRDEAVTDEVRLAMALSLQETRGSAAKGGSAPPSYAEALALPSTAAAPPSFAQAVALHSSAAGAPPSFAQAVALPSHPSEPPPPPFEDAIGMPVDDFDPFPASSGFDPFPARQSYDPFPSRY
ncbi:hypothetical protein AB1Y20_008312 [Prymnesium parvum]|uniref:ubiquitinyl hydrolase 1 n=1 Tax=Prymnesium parvum TaxID=97485 RepID=A0AB34ITU0_PRYPA